MKYFLLVYDRVAGKLLDDVEFASNDAALRERFRREVAAGPDVEVVVLGAEDHGALERTHGRYFQQRGDVDLSRMPARA